MHEVSVMMSLVEEILRVAGENDAECVESVRLEIGELTFLGREQMKFAYEVLTQDNMLKGSKIIIRKTPGRIKCMSCGYEGALGSGKGVNHIMPVFACPKCGGKVSVAAGRECVLKSIRLRKKAETGKPVNRKSVKRKPPVRKRMKPKRMRKKSVKTKEVKPRKRN
jgi:hydrogenase nickel incorporation protein HypA/HybF